MLIKVASTVVAVAVATTLGSCSQKNDDNMTQTRNIINIDNGADAPTLDSQMLEDVNSARVAYDLFEGLTSFDQKQQILPGLAEKWEISHDGKIYTFHLRPNIKFSDGSPITAEDVAFTFQRIANPKTASPYIHLMEFVVNGPEIAKNKLSPTKLGVVALDNKTVQITLSRPNSAFLEICTMPNLGILSKANLSKFGQRWTDPANMVSSGAYKLEERVIKGHILLAKNPYYYDQDNVAIEKVKFLPIEDTSASLSQYKSGNVDITYTIPVDQYKTVQTTMGKQLHTVKKEALYYYDLNLLSPKFKNNPKLRQALNMAINREILVKDILGQEQIPAYSYTTATIENDQFANIEYEWSKLARSEQIAMAQKLFSEAGYSATNPFEISIHYNTNDLHKKVALATASMWQEVFGKTSIKVNVTNQEWKTFIDTRNKGDYEIARDGWNADYNEVNSYADLLLCDNSHNRPRYCSPEYDRLINQAKNTTDSEQRKQLISQALKLAMNDYPIIPVFQYTYFRLISPAVVGYDPTYNYFDHVMSKWYKFK